MNHTHKLLLLAALAVSSFSRTSGQCTGQCRVHDDSPIRIISSRTQPCNPDPLSVDFPAAASRFKVMYSAAKHNVILTPDGASTNTVSFHGARYTLVEIHAHDTTEHVVNGTHPSTELHFVFDRAGNGDSDKLVIGIRVDYAPSASGKSVDVTTTKLIDDIMKTGHRKCSGDHNHADVSLSLNSYQVSGLLNNYFLYCGSLTTEPYNKIVTWVVCASEVRVQTPGGKNVLKVGMCPGTIEGGREPRNATVPVYHVERK